LGSAFFAGFNWFGEDYFAASLGYFAGCHFAALGDDDSERL
jgi:hypothetical protein